MRPMEGKTAVITGRLRGSGKRLPKGWQNWARTSSWAAGTLPLARP